MALRICDNGHTISRDDCFYCTICKSTELSVTAGDSEIEASTSAGRAVGLTGGSGPDRSVHTDDSAAGPIETSAQPSMVALHEFPGNGTGGSVALRIHARHIEYEHKNYVVTVPLWKIASVSYSKDPNPAYASVSIGDITFGCHNKAEVYEALVKVIASSTGVS